ncbi:tRNA (adenosine(37)-N6)-dimethylallyltransferase MiaA [Stieleria sp. JC731]|uniref:tRNA (adenosine(37)-N6)-dimethylallyltransferase MiaA n=1 Tax=Pirellulaceae TaxID=2691357 RepID=UPI001E339FF1|nr:tRNA (adenosine(37)-N6)-dimethylallyltransferase MiaA [Stieleria sp. JC731]MCC9600200.1 tRNA (adenosine(37)-N6)-dimethylallyltransferase MiaA [Stieleria sp. JC731]
MTVSIDSTFPPLIDKAIVLTGATASGKSHLGMKLAERIGGEILSLDSIAVYRNMDIGTAKPTPADREQVPHHLLDLAEPNEDFSVACYLDIAHRCVGEILERESVPIFVGGTPMFLKAILRGFDPGPPPDWEFRQAVEADVERYGVEPLRKRLQQVDPISATKIAPNDVRRMIRALEVSKATGFPLSHRQVQFDRQTDAKDCHVFAVGHPRERLHERINQRVDQMFELGLVDEVRGLIEQYGELSRTASQAVGYREVIQWLQQPEQETLSPLIEEVAAHTRQLARRQETWFRSFSEITPLDVTKFDNVDMMADMIVERVNSRIG